MFLADTRNRPFAVQPRPSLIVRFVDGPHQAQWPSQDAEKLLTGGLQFWLGFADICAILLRMRISVSCRLT
jgi:hypothetical protein